MGDYFKGMLAYVGNDVIFIARGEHLKALQRPGLNF
jgi:ketopantoate reductase